jgi:RNA polymerase primary sigma factor
MPPLPRRKAHALKSVLETYLSEIDETPLLSAEQERKLAYRIENGDAEARDHLVRANLRLVVSIVRGCTGRGLGIEDLIAEGNLGLLRAAEDFDPSMNTRFSTYATYWVKQSIKRALMNTAKMVRVPAYMVDLLAKWRRESAALQAELGRTPTLEEVAGRLPLSKKKLAILKKAIQANNTTPQDEQAETPKSLDDAVADGHTKSPVAEAVEAEDLHQAIGLLDQMDVREAAVLRMRFGLGDVSPKTLQEIGECLSLTRERVRQIEYEAIRKIRERLESPISQRRVESDHRNEQAHRR